MTLPGFVGVFSSFCISVLRFNGHNHSPIFVEARSTRKSLLLLMFLENRLFDALDMRVRVRVSLHFYILYVRAVTLLHPPPSTVHQSHTIITSDSCEFRVLPQKLTM